MSVAGLPADDEHKPMEAFDIPAPTEGPTSPSGVPRTAPGPSWDMRFRGLLAALEARVPGSGGHSRRVAAQSALIAARLGLESTEVARIECAAHVHDVGKIIVSPALLAKPGPLTPLEYAEVQRHATFGARLVDSLEDPGMTEIVRQHHERLDGSGYPDRLRGDEICRGARIVAVADCYDALTSYRPYRAPGSAEMAKAMLMEEAGTTLDADAVAALTC